MPLGTCKLCLKEGVELLDSHLLPKAGFRRLREDGYAPTVLRDITITKDEQIHDYVFCAGCEDLLNKNGETWVLQHCYRPEAGFLLGDLLRATSPLSGHDRMRAFAAASIAGIDVERLAYFGASIFWRASVHDWKTGRDRLEAPKLAEEDEEALRAYLMGDAFPANTVLHLSLISTPDFLSFFSTPYGSREDRRLWLRFWYLGLVFTLWLGDVPADMKRIAFFPSKQSVIGMGSVVEDVLMRDAVDRMRDSKEIS